MSGAPDRKVVVFGASGIVGRAALEHFANRPGWQAVGVSRRPPVPAAGPHLALDLLDRDAAARALGALTDVTHVVYAALYEKPGLLEGWKAEDQMATNLAMLRNALEPLLEAARGLRHVSLLQGTKAYGVHYGLMRVPGREREPRVEHPNFYWLHEDWLRERRVGAPWTFTIWRPPLILGHAVGAPMNVIGALCAWAALCRARGEPFAWPGNGVRLAYDAVDADLLAEAFAWAAEGGGAPDATYNVTNGDVFVPRHLWPALAQAFGLPTGPDRPASLAAELAAAAEWPQIARRFDLRFPDLGRWLGDSGIYADVFLNPPPDPGHASPLLSTIALRQAGFDACLDTEDVFVRWIRRLREMGFAPPADRRR